MKELSIFLRSNNLLNDKDIKDLIENGQTQNLEPNYIILTEKLNPLQ